LASLLIGQLPCFSKFIDQFFAASKNLLITEADQRYLMLFTSSFLKSILCSLFALVMVDSINLYPQANFRYEEV